MYSYKRYLCSIVVTEIFTNEILAIYQMKSISTYNVLNIRLMFYLTIIFTKEHPIIFINR